MNWYFGWHSMFFSLNFKSPGYLAKHINQIVLELQHFNKKPQILPPPSPRGRALVYWSHLLPSCQLPLLLNTHKTPSSHWLCSLVQFLFLKRNKRIHSLNLIIFFFFFVFATHTSYMLYLMSFENHLYLLETLLFTLLGQGL